MKKIILGCGIAMTVLPAFAAVHIDLDKQQGFIPPVERRSSLVEQTRSVDFNQTLHIRLKQHYKNYPIYGADIVSHVPSLMTDRPTMNGDAYQDLANDLQQPPEIMFTYKHEQAAIAVANKHFVTNQNGLKALELQAAKPMIYIDDKNKAHWVYHLQFEMIDTDKDKTMPTYIVDAMTHTIYKAWNNLKSDMVLAGGYGGNHKTGQKVFDGGDKHFPAMLVERNPNKNNCYMRNDAMVINDVRTGKAMTFGCSQQDDHHENVFWNGNHDQIETTWSPSNDVMTGAAVTQAMFNDWYQIPVLEKDGKAMRLKANVHLSDANAYWDGKQVIFGDSSGSRMFNPFTQLDTVAHEICHGFTEQHSDLQYYEQSGGLNEAFSDIAGIAAEFYRYGKTDYLVGWGDVKAEDKALRYMDQPSKDCDGKRPGSRCSIDHISQYNDRVDVHYSSGIFNRVYYTLANMKGWNPRKAFDVMVQANRHYWTPTVTFAKAACGVKKAAKDYHYNVNDIVTAFNVVGINLNECK